MGRAEKKARGAVVDRLWNGVGFGLQLFGGDVDWRDRSAEVLTGKTVWRQVLTGRKRREPSLYLCEVVAAIENLCFPSRRKRGEKIVNYFSHQ
jgi:hypothetical protein